MRQLQELQQLKGAGGRVLSPKQLKALQAVQWGMKWKDVAEWAEVSRDTVHHWRRNDPVFEAGMKIVQKLVFNDVQCRMSTTLQLERVMHFSTPATAWNWLGCEERLREAGP